MRETVKEDRTDTNKTEANRDKEKFRRKKALKRLVFRGSVKGIIRPE